MKIAAWKKKKYQSNMDLCVEAYFACMFFYSKSFVCVAYILLDLIDSSLLADSKKPARL